MSNGIDLLMVDQVDPFTVAPNGIDTVIRGLIKYSASERIGIIGSTSSSAIRVGQWTCIEVEGRSVLFLAVSKGRSTHWLVSRVPDSVRLTFGLVRFRNRIPRVRAHAHRVEIGVVLRGLLRAEYVQFIHNDSKGLLGAESDSLWKRLSSAYRWLELRALRNASAVVLFNKSDSGRLREIRSDLFVATTWYDPSLVATRVSQDSCDVLYLCWVGRFESQKDPLLAVATLACLVERGVDVRMTFVGSGSMQSEMEADIRLRGLSEYCVFTGSIPRAQVLDEMARQTVLLITSHYEGSPTVLVEAGASGLPIVGTYESDPDHLVNNHENGVVVRSRDPFVIADAVIAGRVCESTACREAVSERSGPKIVPQILRLGRTS
ncbi:glycosyltransferase family 4 protein [Rhodococcus jostii]|uniref:Glycosyltransferase involved in cell wall bisynthesis n=1 Tax=Rhodococcus jostii TaxID=132919 RepID=A0A1H5HLG2_RHOJO|nr:glycosyltransferase [Rhodococcus jostii]SEE28511.1 Glycosyltransferase involved in cell wall bisynthesis [Rhodococcus jostii]